MSSYAVIKLKLRAEIGDTEFKDVIQYTSTFAINTIPMATILVAVGRNVSDDKLATIHKNFDQFKIQEVAKVYLTAEIMSEEKAYETGVPDGKEFLIFEGKTAGIGFRRTENGAHFTIHLIHWLGDLNNSSAISASSHPGNPGDWTYPALYAAINFGDDTNASHEPSWVPMIHEGSISPGSLDDIWGNVIHKWMTHVASDDPFEDNLQGGQPGGGNENTIDAIKRMAPNDDGVELAIELSGSDADTIANGIRQALQNENGSNWINTTLWGKLVGDWAPAYWFSVIPRIEDALIVPFTGGLRGAPWAVIGDEDYTQGELHAQLQQILRAVGIVHPIKWATQADMNVGSIPNNRGGAAGWYQPDEIEKGLVLLKDAPKWLSDPLTEYVFSRGSQAVAGDEVVNGALDEENVGGERNPARDVKDIQKKNKAIMDNYAQQWYVLESLKGRMGEITGKLRFDIAPGSNVLVEAGRAVNIPGQQDKLHKNVFATVVQVAYIINSESAKAGTAFTLAHVRTGLENTKDATSVVKPPLYQTEWRGAALTKAVKVEKQ